MYQADHERYVFAEQLYCFTDKRMHEIAELAKIPLRTLYQRARDYDWATLRRASKRSPMILCEEMYRELADLTESINKRPEGQRIPTSAEAETRRKIVYTIAAVKKFPTHAEAAFLMQSLIRYATNFHWEEVQNLQKLVDAFLSHRDVYGYASYQPEHNQDINHISEQDIEKEFNEIDTPSYRHPDDTTSDINKDIVHYQHPDFSQAPDIIGKFKIQRIEKDALIDTPLKEQNSSNAATGSAFSA